MADGPSSSTPGGGRLPAVPGQDRYIHAGQLTFLGDEALMSLGAQLGMVVAKAKGEVLAAETLVVGVSSVEAISVLYEVVHARSPRGVDAVIAWRLREEHLGSLYLLGVPIIVGEPTVEELLAALNKPLDPARHQADRHFSAELGLLEAIFEQRPA